MGVFIIAEAGVNHNGDIAIAKELIDVAASAGADAVKFQTWKTELLVTMDAAKANYQETNTGSDESQYEMLKRLEISYDGFRELKFYCDQKNIMFLSTADELESASFLNELQDIFKIGSGELNNIPFLEHIGSFGKEIILSTGMGTLEEINFALNILVKAGTEKKKITILHATTAYPTNISDVNLKAMLTIGKAFNVRYGYSDHTLGTEVSIAAAALGASVIEKHFTLDKKMQGPDHIASIGPDELKELILKVRNIEKALGTGKKEPNSAELKNMEHVRKSIVANEEIHVGDIFTKDNLTVKRPGTGISPKEWFNILGTKSLKNYKKNDLI